MKLKDALILVAIIVQLVIAGSATSQSAGKTNSNKTVSSQKQQLPGDIFLKYPEGKIPAETDHLSQSHVYCYAYISNKTKVEENPLIFISNVFKIEKHNDGSWPLKSELIAELQKRSSAGTVTLVGYYFGYDNAAAASNNLMNDALSAGFTVKMIEYNPQPSQDKEVGN